MGRACSTEEKEEIILPKFCVYESGNLNRTPGNIGPPKKIVYRILVRKPEV
jgi:hypothetical protein